ncbi:MAG TPA: YceI family protein [Bryobacteraceae bacterium]|jgi:polyisoprenoid-binding protein YceI|nr:YceI family protein [Bryobacteraceae bacterium]
MRARNFSALWLTLASLAWIPPAHAGQQAIDTAKSVMTVRVYKSGVFSAFGGHDHEIAAPVAGGFVDTAARRVELRVQAAALRVRDSKGSEKDHNEIQKTMVGPEVLDAERNPEIVFKSTTVEPAGSNVWKVRGEVTLHGQTRPVTLQVTERDGHFVGNTLLKQRDFGIKPVSVAGGTVRVKDEVRIEFDIQLTR